MRPLQPGPGGRTWPRSAARCHTGVAAPHFDDYALLAAVPRLHAHCKFTGARSPPPLMLAVRARCYFVFFAFADEPPLKTFPAYENPRGEQLDCFQ